MNKFIHDILTDANGDYEIIEICTGLLVLALIFVVVYEAMHGGAVNIQDIGIGGGSLLAGNGVGGKFKPQAAAQ